MIYLTDENVFNTNSDCITNTVNCVGVMGKGLALEFALRFPKLEAEYIKQCKAHAINVNSVYFYEIDNQKIINFPTKKHFKDPSQLEWIENGLKDILQNYKKWNITSLALPLLGARNGGLDSSSVIDLIKETLKDIDIDVYICLNKKQDDLSIDFAKKFNELDFNSVSSILNLTKKQSSILSNAQGKIKDIHQVASLNGIGSQTLKKLYRFMKEEKPILSEQLSLF